MLFFRQVHKYHKAYRKRIDHTWFHFMNVFIFAKGDFFRLGSNQDQSTFSTKRVNKRSVSLSLGGRICEQSIFLRSCCSVVQPKGERPFQLWRASRTLKTMKLKVRSSPYANNKAKPSVAFSLSFIGLVASSRARFDRLSNCYWLFLFCPSKMLLSKRELGHIA